MLKSFAALGCHWQSLQCKLYAPRQAIRSYTQFGKRKWKIESKVLHGSNFNRIRLKSKTKKKN